VFTKLNRNQLAGVTGVRWLNPLYTYPQIVGGRIQYFNYYAPNMNPDETRQIQPGEMAYRISHRNSRDDLRGYPPAMSALDAMNIDRNAKRGVRAYFVNAMQPGGAMSPKDNGTGTNHLHDTEIQRMQQRGAA
jgi:hypothetical protein